MELVMLENASEKDVKLNVKWSIYSAGKISFLAFDNQYTLRSGNSVICYVDDSEKQRILDLGYIEVVESDNKSELVGVF